MTRKLIEGAQIGRYVLLTKLASGGMADVWLARVEGIRGFQKTVVVKTLLPHLADNPDFVQMFIDEANLASKIHHPNVIDIFDLGESGGVCFIAMEYVRGRTLRHLQRELRRTNRVPPPWLILYVIASACDALHHAHNMVDSNNKPMRIVHRDISPENLIVSFAGETKVLDFGIAKPMNTGLSSYSKSIKGKYAYVAPEQIEGGGADPRGDVYSAGVVLYELMTGRRPFRAETELALLKRALDVEPEAPSSFCPWISEPLSDLILRAMARDINDRFQSAIELRDAIEEYFRSTRSIPTRTHVSNYIQGLFGDSPPYRETDEMAPNLETSGIGVQDPWEDSGDIPSVTVDLATLGTDSSLPAMDSSHPLSPSGANNISTDSPVHPDSRSDDWLLDVDAGWSSVRSQDLAQPEVDAFESAATDLQRSKPPKQSISPTADKQTARPRDVATPTETVETTSVSPVDPKLEREHLWDKLTQRVREEKRVAVQEREDELRHPTSSRDRPEPHAWDLAVGRIRGDRRTSVAAKKEKVEAEKGASDWFDEGLTCWHDKDLEGTLACWSKAVELDPENRRYSSNLRRLKRHMDRSDNP